MGWKGGICCAISHELGAYYSLGGRVMTHMNLGIISASV